MELNVLYFQRLVEVFFIFNLVEAKILNFLTVHMVRVKSDTEEKETAIIF